jgi:hypothetical protein
VNGFDLATFLKMAVPDMAPSGIGKWKFPLQPAASESASFQLTPHWVSFGFALPHRSAEPPSPMAALLCQVAWPGNVKLVADPALRLRAEVPLILDTVADRDWLLRQIGDVVQGLRSGANDHAPGTSADADSGCDIDLELLADRCRAAGWHAVVSADGEIYVDIVARSVRRLVSVARGTTGLCLRVTLGEGELAQACVESVAAVTHFLARASASLRFARAWASCPAGSLSEIGFECTIAASGGDSPFVMAIDALATASDLFGREAEALIESAVLARRYLQLAGCARGSSAPPVMHPHSPTTAAVLPRAAAAAAPF